MNILMKVKNSPSTGKGYFFKRLANQLIKQGHRIVSTPSDKHDIYLAHNGFKWGTNAPRVLRVDGVYNDVKRPYKRLNREIATQCSKADAIIYQSNWSRGMHRKYVGKYHVQDAVIYNGAPLNQSDIWCSEKILVAASRWRAHKRLKSIMQAATLAKDITLHIYGDVSKPIRSPNIVYHGHRNQAEIAKVLSVASGFVHICWQDACPNSVVEALSHYVPVLCNNVGGTPEIVSKCGGMVMDLDKPYDMRPVDLYHPPKIDIEKLAAGMSKIAEYKGKIDPWTVNIENIGLQYEFFFKRVLG